ncbi:AMP-binding protein [Kordiimonas pumila]|uniref:AMP-binding protein n=1 Tax=Kordiimonas pumila TaxID=2161677 RepID=A0ABV7D9I8_9PROT|nr:AMP-binding protein [Kordiimonas pumila]
MTSEAINTDTYWETAAQAVDWFSPWHTLVNTEDGPGAKWFDGATCNTCHNAVDRHVAAGGADRAALIYESPVTGSEKTYTYGDLQKEVALLAGVLAANGVCKGDRVIIYMPMVPEAVFAMLACARLGAIHSVVFGGFADHELAKRIQDATPKLVLAASCGIEPSRVVAYKPLLDSAIKLSSHKPGCCIILQREQLKAELVEGRDIDWAEALLSASPHGVVPVAATDPLYILYTSGTTGAPKGVVRDNGGHMAALTATMQNFYGVGAGDVFWAASDIGWVVGHSYIVYAPLLVGATTILFEGKPVGTPDAGVFWRTVEKYKVKALFTAPTAIRAIRRDDPTGSFIKKADISTLKALFLAGERADPPTIEWAKAELNIPVIDHWWQTELGWPALGVPLVGADIHIKTGSAGKPVTGFTVLTLDEASRPLPTGEMGDIVIKLPLPPGAFPALWQNMEGYKKAYFSKHAGYYLTGDAGYIDDDGFVYVMARTDDIINVAGHRLSTGDMEEVIAGHPAVAECAVMGVSDPIKGMIPVGLAVLSSGAGVDTAVIGREIVTRVRDQIGPVAAFKHVGFVKQLPKTRSGKILRATLRKIADGETVVTPATIDDPLTLEYARNAFKGMGLG